MNAELKNVSWSSASGLKMGFRHERRTSHELQQWDLGSKNKIKLETRSAMSDSGAPAACGTLFARGPNIGLNFSTGRRQGKLYILACEQTQQRIETRYKRRDSRVERSGAELRPDGSMMMRCCGPREHHQLVPCSCSVALEFGHRPLALVRGGCNLQRRKEALKGWDLMSCTVPANRSIQISIPITHQKVGIPCNTTVQPECRETGFRVLPC